jgi:PAS domain S-box
MKLEYKIIVLSVMVGVSFIVAESMSTLISNNPNNLTKYLEFLFEPLTTNQNLFFYISIILLCFIFGFMLSRMINQVLRAKDAAKKNDIEKNMILDFVPEIVIYTDNELRIKWASRSLYTEVGTSKEEMVDRYFDEVALSLFDRETIIEQLNTFRTNPIMNIEMSSKKGKYWQILSNHARDENGNGNGYVFLAIDVTKNKRDEEMKRRSYEQLESNIEQFATVIDNIRNPLSSVVLLAEVSANEKTSEKIIQQCDDIEEVISKLDEGWAKSEDIRNFLKKHL